METASHVRGGHGRGSGLHDTTRPHSRNKHWVAGESGKRSSGGNPHHSDGERWERGGHRGGHGIRGISRGGRVKFPNASLRVPRPNHAESNATNDEHMDDAVQDHTDDEAILDEPALEEPAFETPEEREKFYQELVKARELERKKAIAEGKMDDPAVPKRLDDAISVVGTCLDMCPRFERYRRERENNLFEWETIPGTKRVDHKRAVKMYERAAGDKTIPSDLRPPPVLKRTLDYLFHDLLPRGGFSQTFNFIRDRSRAVRNDFTMQHNSGPIAIECHDRCARFHILALHFERDEPGFSVALEEQQLMNTLQTLKEFYEDQRGRYESPTELEMRVYHRLIHIRDQKERHEDIPEHITSHPVFQLTTDFRLHVQNKSAPISKTSPLIVDAEGMQIFGNLANVLRNQGSVVMIYLVACILERLFGKDAIDDIEGIRGDLSIPDIIDGVSTPGGFVEDYEDNVVDGMHDELEEEAEYEPTSLEPSEPPSAPQPLILDSSSSAFGGLSTASTFSSLVESAPPKQPVSAFSTISTTPNVFNTPSPFGNLTFPSSSTSVFSTSPPTSTFAPLAQQPSASTTAAPPTQAAISSGFASPAPSFFPTSQSISTSSITSAASSSSQMNLFNVPSGATPSKAATAPPAKSFVPSPLKSSFGQPSVAQPAPTAVNGLSFNGAMAANLNPKAPIFTPKVPPPTPVSPFGSLFQRSSSPSPSPVPLPSNVPPTPAPLPSSSSFLFPPSSSKKPSPPSSQRTSTTPPVLPKINTDTSSTSFLQTELKTPTFPPSLPKHKPISLPPSTPITGVTPSTALPGFFKSTLETAISSSNQEILSPLFLPSPTSSGLSIVNNFSPNGKIKAFAKAGPDRLGSLINGKGKSPAKVTIDENALQAKLMQFAQKSVVVKASFQHWHKRLLERVAWIEACQQSEAYGQKVKRQRHSLDSHFDKKRRISTGSVTTDEMPQKKRVRKRMSDYQPPRTDEELARRFKENHEEHERRWAQGSFLNVIRHHVKTKFHGGDPHPSWRIWLSMNPESDATAIWLERKFDVPNSGEWASEAVFSIPLMQPKDPTAPEYPGIIVFECTPLEGVTDDLERKYRILDDCARLRDIVNIFPSKRHFIPSLLVISWMEPEQAKIASDFVDMVNNLLEHNSIQSYHTLWITSSTKDLDNKLGEALNALTLDLEGKLVRPLTIRGTFKLFERRFTSFISEWIENCSINGHFDWHIFGQIVEVAVALMNMTARSVSGLISEDLQDHRDLLPEFHGGDVVDNNSAYEDIVAWLSTTGLGTSADNIAQNLQSYRDIGQEFPARALIEHLWELTQSQTEIQLQRDSRTKFYIPIAEINASVESQEAAYQPFKTRLGQTLHLSIRRSPKRRSVSVDTEGTSVQSKRRRLSSSVESSIGFGGEDYTPATSPNGNVRLTPSPTSTSVSLAPSEPPSSGVVTIAMLRALTRDVKRKYAGAGS
ncbi:SAC3 family protein 1 [Hypsizygus marmoreus]|uniref:SAC3 family protein 1 n=1 Tax=Hypsizygus marmoreus TaxID=39966 RepID=A0A369JML7_HYPMA|nr:SAC3 family protein 1 [Hypsizygus marmoreus]